MFFFLLNSEQNITYFEWRISIYLCIYVPHSWRRRYHHHLCYTGIQAKQIKNQCCLVRVGKQASKWAGNVRMSMYRSFVTDEIFYAAAAIERLREQFLAA